MNTAVAEGAASVKFSPAGVVIGIALSGFFDGILLHQVLQWHHLLSLVEGALFDDLRVQVFADGMFHILMYLVALTGILMLWREGRPSLEAGDRRLFWAGLILGFGLWNIADVVLFHWILEIHHIRVDTEDYLFWDIAWLAVLGIAPALAGWWLRRKPPGGPSSPAIRSAAGRAIVTAGVLVVGALSMRAPATEMTTVLFRPGMDPTEVMAAVAAVDGAWVAGDQSGTLAVIKLPAGVSPWRLYRHGAVLVGAAGPAGCLSWIRPA